MSMSTDATIYYQLGGRRFLAMTGAKYLVALEDGLQFKLPARFAKRGINLVRIRLNDLDLYDLECLKVRGLDATTVEAINNIYANDLQRIFREVTGLDTHL